jgi:hypothetical protein
MRGKARLLCIAWLGACGDDSAAPPDAGPPDASNLVRGPLLELPLRAPIDPSFPAQHSNEVTIAARGDTVVATYRNVHHLSADGWVSDPAAPGGGRQVAVATSTDRGETYSLAEPDAVDSFFSDPVVRVGPDGTFWLVRLRIGDPNPCSVHVSSDGIVWTAKPDIACSDKPWLAVDGDSAWVASAAGMMKIPADGSPSTSTDDSGTANWRLR